MPLEIKDELINELVKREAMKERFAPKQPEPRIVPEGSVNPTLLAILGAIGDGATTYRFLKNGTAAEDNAMLQGMGPVGTGLAGAGSGIGTALAGRLLKGKLPQSLIDAIVSNMGAHQTVMTGTASNGTNGEGAFKAARRVLSKVGNRK